LRLKRTKAGKSDNVCEVDHVRLLKLFTPMGGATWLLTEYCPEDGRFIGLCDLGMGSPELGYVNSEEIEQTAYSRRPPIIERDLYFRPAYSLSVYADAARRACRITENPIDLSAAKGVAR
jgi:hypothetical protein